MGGKSFGYKEQVLWWDLTCSWLVIRLFFFFCSWLEFACPKDHLPPRPDSSVMKFHNFFFFWKIFILFSLFHLWVGGEEGWGHTHGGSMRVSDPLELELQMLMGHLLWVWEVELGSSRKVPSAPNCWDVSLVSVVITSSCKVLTRSFLTSMFLQLLFKDIDYILRYFPKNQDAKSQRAFFP